MLNSVGCGIFSECFHNLPLHTIRGLLRSDSFRTMNNFLSTTTCINPTTIIAIDKCSTIFLSTVWHTSLTSVAKLVVVSSFFEGSPSFFKQKHQHLLSNSRDKHKDSSNPTQHSIFRPQQLPEEIIYLPGSAEWIFLKHAYRWVSAFSWILWSQHL